VIDAAWEAARDEQWHSLRSLADRTQLGTEAVTAALDFLLRYGFGQSCVLDGLRFRIIGGGPSPMEAADLLRSLQLGVNWRMSEWS